MTRIVGGLPEQGMRIDVTLVGNTTYEGRVDTPERSHPLSVTFGPSEDVTISLEGGSRSVQEKLRLLFRTVKRHEGEQPLPKRIVRWRDMSF